MSFWLTNGCFVLSLREENKPAKSDKCKILKLKYFVVLFDQEC